MIVVDTNIIAYFYIPGEYTPMVSLLMRKEPYWAAPLLWRSEFLSVLALHLRKGIFDLNQAILKLQKAIQLMEGNEFQVPALQVLSLAARSSCSAYDCEFVALAQMLSTVLVTTDEQILREFPDIAIRPDAFLAQDRSN